MKNSIIMININISSFNEFSQNYDSFFLESCGWNVRKITTFASRELGGTFGVPKKRGGSWTLGAMGATATRFGGWLGCPAPAIASKVQRTRRDERTD
jgi:hypothetical protein